MFLFVCFIKKKNVKRGVIFLISEIKIMRFSNETTVTGCFAILRKWQQHLCWEFLCEIIVLELQCWLFFHLKSKSSGIKVS